MKLYEVKPDSIMTISSTNVGHKHVKMYWHTNNPNTKVKVVFNSSTRLWACGNMTGKKPIELARKALHAHPFGEMRSPRKGECQVLGGLEPTNEIKIYGKKQ